MKDILAGTLKDLGEGCISRKTYAFRSNNKLLCNDFQIAAQCVEYKRLQRQVQLLKYPLR
jgi:hypothetical protein